MSYLKYQQAEAALLAEAERGKERDAALALEAQRVKERDAALARHRLASIEPRYRGWEWHHFRRQSAGGIFALYGHTSAGSVVMSNALGTRVITGAVTGVAFSPDGTRIVTGSYDRTAKVRDARTGAPLLDLKGHTKPVYSVAFTADGSRIVTVAGDWKNPGVAKVWDARTGTESKGVPIPQTIANTWTSPDGRLFANPEGNRVELIPLRPDAEELSYRRLHTQPNLGRYRDGYEAAQAANDDCAAWFHLNLIVERKLAAGRTQDAVVQLARLSAASPQDAELFLQEPGLGTGHRGLLPRHEPVPARQGRRGPRARARGRGEDEAAARRRAEPAGRQCQPRGPHLVAGLQGSEVLDRVRRGPAARGGEGQEITPARDRTRAARARRPVAGLRAAFPGDPPAKIPPICPDFPDLKKICRSVRGGGPFSRIEGSGSANAEPRHEPAITGGSHFLRRVGKKTAAGL